MSVRLALVTCALALACGTPATVASPTPAIPSPTQTAPPPATPTASPSPTPLPPGAIAFTVDPARSVATIRVREQVAGIPAPGEAVLTTNAFSGSLVLLADGSFARGSVLSVELDTLDSDSELRDEWIKINTLETRSFPRAELTAIRLTGVPLPLPAAGAWQAKLEGTMGVHGVDRPLTWDLAISRAAGEVRAAGETEFKFGDHGMAVPANRLILSVVDHIRLAIDVVIRDEMRGS